ncbi:MAG: class I tRNA ligase family protein, partial [Candidatus Adiutrix sp.]
LPEEGQTLDANEPSDDETRYWLHSTIKAITSDLARFSYNTAVARLMELVNHLTKNRIKNKVVSEALVRMLAPLAPHVAEELWSLLGHKTTVFSGGWPSYDEKAAVRSQVEYVVQINGKLRGKIEMPKGLTPEEIEPQVMANPIITRWLEGKTIVKKIYVPDKLVNLVIK